ncbi:MAG: pilin [Burkholderiales bacterium]|nr:pilin [Burkholderiales bacterium]
MPGAGGWGCESASSTSKYVASVATSGTGEITVTAQGFGDSAIDTKTIVLTPTISGSVVTSWTCGGTIPAKFRPGSCKG